MIRRNDGFMVYAIGRSRSGKTQWIKQQIKKDKRIIVWDIQGEYSLQKGFVSVESIGALIAKLKVGGALKIAYQPNSLKEFEIFCRCAYNWLRQDVCTIIIEELADVSSAGKAPDAWGIICRRGLKFGPSIYASTQRPQEADKTILGNTSMVHIHAPNTQADRDYIAKKIGVDEETIPSEKLYFLQKYSEGAVKTGKLKFKNKKKV